MTVQTGLDAVARAGHPALRGRRVGLIVHQASVTSGLEHAVDVFRRRRDVRVAALFAPEHGFFGELQDQVPVKGARDRRTGLPVFSLYGDRRHPDPAFLKNLDTVVFDLQDIGVRYYTFIWTLALALRAAARAGKRFVVLDRPNPLGGEKIDGNWPDPAFASFVGLHPLPVLHGLTAGELALYLNATQGWGADLRVVPLAGWARDRGFDQTGLPWVPPSPNMPTLDTAQVYGGTCLLEATNLSEGRGTTRPFEIVGAPFIDGPRWAAALGDARLPGVRFRPLIFRPTFHKWAGRPCGGVQLHVTDRDAHRPFLTGLTLLGTARRLWPRRFRWNPPPYEYETVRPPIDILCGTDAPRRAIDAGADLRRLARTWGPALQDYRRRRAPSLLYS